MLGEVPWALYGHCHAPGRHRPTAGPCKAQARGALRAPQRVGARRVPRSVSTSSFQVRITRRAASPGSPLLTPCWSRAQKEGDAAPASRGQAKGEVSRRADRGDSAVKEAAVAFACKRARGGRWALRHGRKPSIPVRRWNSQPAEVQRKQTAGGGRAWLGSKGEGWTRQRGGRRVVPSQEVSETLLEIVRRRQGLSQHQQQAALPLRSAGLADSAPP